MSFTLTEYHDAVIDWLTSDESFTDWLVDAQYYPEISESPTEASAYFGVTDWELTNPQKGTGEITMDLNCQLLVVFPETTTDLQLTIREAVMEICLGLDSQRFGLEIKPPLLTSAEPDTFNTELDDCEVWSIRWIQEIEMTSVNDSLEADLFEPTTVYAGLSPEVGSDYEQSYSTLYEASDSEESE